MSKFTEIMGMLDGMLDDTNDGDVYTAPVKGAKNGEIGKITDARVRAYMGNYRAKNPLKPTPQGRPDTRKFGYKVAIKTGFGEITPCNRNGEPKTKEFISCDVVIWCAKPKDTEIGEMLVVRVVDLWNSDIVRRVKSSAMYRKAKEGAPEEDIFKDQIQFVSSKPKVEKWFSDNAIGTLDQWLETHGAI